MGRRCQMYSSKTLTQVGPAKISLRAIGLLAQYETAGRYIPSAQVAQSFSEGRDAVRTALAELVTHGYVNAEQYRVGSQWSTKYTLNRSATDPPVGFSGLLTDK